NFSPVFAATLLRVDDGSPYEVAEQEFEARMTADAMHPALPLDAREELVVNVGPSIGLESIVSKLDASATSEVAVAKIARVDQLPTRWYGYDGVATVVLATSQPEAWRALSSTSAQLAALDEWVRLGGRLVLTVGASAPEALAPSSPLVRFLPGKYAGLAPLRQLRDLETFTGATEPLSIPVAPAGEGGAAEARLDVPQLTDVRGLVEVNEGAALPLVVRAPYGFGEVVFVALDLDRPPLATWNDRGKLVAKILRLPLENSAAAENAPPNFGGGGEGDISGQLARGLDEFVGVKIAPFSLVALLIAGYILLIGPVDYWLVKRVFKRMELTWITFPLIVVGVSVGAYLLASWMKGDRLLVNQAQVVDVDLGSQLVRGTEWINVFSPAVERYDISVAPHLPDGAAAADARRLVSWLGKPDGSFGAGQPGGTSRFRGGYSFTPELDAMDRVPIQFWSTKPFSARWDLTAPQADEWIEVDLKPAGTDAVEGKLVSKLPAALKGAMLLYRRSVYRLGDVAAGAEVAIDPAERRELRSELRAGGEYNAYTAEVPEVLARMMFYEAYGASPEMRLAHQYQEYLDLSRHLEMGQAILVGRVESGSLNLLLDGRPAPEEGSRSWTYYRFLIPIEPDTSE
ncbi:MAG: hypothetical protein JNG90_01110, partial [Planctomycetaceae bacterium]|nr:hypothetical protein [Planctomycetaceae bacterium]